jgi:hypothetical protein
LRNSQSINDIIFSVRADKLHEHVLATEVERGDQPVPEGLGTTPLFTISPALAALPILRGPVAASGVSDALLAFGVMRALNRRVERVFNPDRKEHHWGRPKLARDR